MIFKFTYFLNRRFFFPVQLVLYEDLLDRPSSPVLSLPRRHVPSLLSLVNINTIAGFRHSHFSAITLFDLHRFLLIHALVLSASSSFFHPRKSPYDHEYALKRIRIRIIDFSRDDIHLLLDREHLPAVVYQVYRLHGTAVVRNIPDRKHAAVSARAPARRKPRSSASSASELGWATDPAGKKSAGLNSHQGRDIPPSTSMSCCCAPAVAVAGPFCGTRVSMFSKASSLRKRGQECQKRLLPELHWAAPLGARNMPFEMIAHGVFSFLSGVSVTITGFGCDSARELFAELSTGPNAYPASSAINMGLSAALVTAVQVRSRTGQHVPERG